MSFFANLLKKYNRATPKQLVLSGVFMLTLAGTIGAGFGVSSNIKAAEQRDGSNNSIMRWGALSPSELIGGIRENKNGVNGDLPGIYAHFHLTADKYDAFAADAKQGTFYRDGHVEVGGVTVASTGYSMGRQNFNNSASYTIPGVGTYYTGTPSQRWASGVSSIPVMVWFDEDGIVRTMVMNPCGNPLPHFDKKRPSYSCDMLSQHAVSGKKNTYQFSADASNNNMAQVTKFTYSYDDGSGWKVFDTTTSESTKTKEITFTKATKVKVEVEVTLMNGKKKTVTSTSCEKEIGVVKEEFLYVCEALVATARDNTNSKFRFTVKTKQSNNVTVDSADFTLDSTITTKGVTDKDTNGNLYKDYDFTDVKTHTVSVVVNFTADGKTVQSKEVCKAKVSPDVCVYNPELPPNHPDCKAPECPEKPGSGFPPGDERCKELPKTGAGSVAGLFAGITAAGALGHRWYTSRRNRA